MNPDPTPDVVWRPIARSDADALDGLYRAWEDANAIPYRTSRDELLHWMDDPNVDLDRDTRVAVDAEGRLVACLWVFIGSPTKIKHRAILTMASRPERAELERPAIRWGEAVARRRFADRTDGLPRIARGFAEVHETARIGAYEAEGFEVVRFFVDMIRSLDDPIAETVVPDDVELQPWGEQWVESAHAAHCEAFADHWGSLPPSIEEWRHWVTAPNFRADLSHVAVSSGEVVAYSLNGVYPDDFDRRGRREGWIDTLGTRQAWRRQGVASALITVSMRGFAGAGLDHAALGVDAANPTGAFGVYANLGFQEVSRAVSVAKPLD